MIVAQISTRQLKNISGNNDTKQGNELLITELRVSEDVPSHQEKQELNHQSYY